MPMYLQQNTKISQISQTSLWQKSGVMVNPRGLLSSIKICTKHYQTIQGTLSGVLIGSRV